jgi:hypothetical protein
MASRVVEVAGAAEFGVGTNEDAGHSAPILSSDLMWRCVFEYGTRRGGDDVAFPAPVAGATTGSAAVVPGGSAASGRDIPVSRLFVVPLVLFRDPGVSFPDRRQGVYPIPRRRVNAD